MSLAKKLLLVNFIVLLFIELERSFVVQLSVDASIQLQQGVQGDNNQRLVWLAAEMAGPDPRTVSMMFIIFLAQTGEEASRWFILRFLATYSRWVLGMILQEPRPSWESDKVQMLHCPRTFGLPSGHATILSAFAFSFCLSRSWKWTPLVLMWYLGMCIGRVYLGTHSIHDLVFGTSLGVNLAVFVKDAAYVQGLQNFLRDEGLLLVFVLLAFGLSACFGFVQLGLQLSDSNVVKQYTDRVKDNGCTPLELFNPMEGILSLVPLAAWMVSTSVNRWKLSPRRWTSAAVYLLPYLLIVPMNLFTEELKSYDVPYAQHVVLGVTALCSFFSVLSLFTSFTKEEEHMLLIQKQERARAAYGATLNSFF